MTPARRVAAFARRFAPLLVILAAAALVRWPMLTQIGYRWDTYSFEEWALRLNRDGLFTMYRLPDPGDGLEVNHPPLGVALLAGSVALAYPGGVPTPAPDAHVSDTDPAMTRALKLPIFAFDLILIALGYLVALRERNVLWAVALGSALAFNPGLALDSAWWGQTDVMYCVFLVGAVYWLRQPAPGLAWLCYALALLTKFQAVVLLPLMLAITLRRGGLHGLARGGAVFAVAGALGLLPFMLGGGPRETLRPYVDTLGQYPFVTLKAHNFWFWALSATRDMEAPWHKMPPDTQAAWGEGVYWGPFSARMVGLGLVGLCALLVMACAWFAPHAPGTPPDDFWLAAALYAAFFAFSTQMQVRYLYPALVMLCFAALRARWRWVLVAAMSLTVGYNILVLAAPGWPLWDDLRRLLAWRQYENALLNMLLAAVLLCLPAARLVGYLRDHPFQPRGLRPWLTLRKTTHD